REWGAVCVTGARDVMELLEFSEDEPPPGERRVPVLARDLLGPVDARVLEAVPDRAGARADGDRSRGGFRHGHALPGRAGGRRVRGAVRARLAAAAATTAVTCRTKGINARFLPDSGQESCTSAQ